MSLLLSVLAVSALLFVAAFAVLALTGRQVGVTAPDELVDRLRAGQQPDVLIDDAVLDAHIEAWRAGMSGAL